MIDAGDCVCGEVVGVRGVEKAMRVDVRIQRESDRSMRTSRVERRVIAGCSEWADVCGDRQLVPTRKDHLYSVLVKYSSLFALLLFSGNPDELL